METQIIRYRKLFQVEVLLHHLLDEGVVLFDDLSDAAKLRKLGRYQISQWMEFVPGDATAAAMAGLGWVFKPTSTGFLVVASADPETNSPMTLPAPDLKLDFEMVLHKAGFSEFSAFPLPGKLEGKRALYVFDTAATNAGNAAAFPTIAMVPPGFSNSVVYEPGQIVRSGSNRFVSKQKTMGNATSSNEHWVRIGEGLPYANSAHLARRDDFPVSDRAFGLIRVDCAPNLGDFGLFQGSNLRSPVYKIRLRKKAA